MLEKSLKVNSEIQKIDYWRIARDISRQTDNFRGFLTPTLAELTRPKVHPSTPLVLDQDSSP